MPETLPITPYVPQYITVHLGSPGSNAENVTVSFPDYVKNVASSEIYPTWKPAALRANILAIISFALNRVYTEFYPSRGYPFNITSSTAYDQKFIKGRNIFENISQLVDIRDVKIDRSLPSEERIKSFIEQIKNPYQFKVGDTVVKVSFANTQNTITDNFINMIATM